MVRKDLFIFLKSNCFRRCKSEFYVLSQVIKGLKMALFTFTLIISKKVRGYVVKTDFSDSIDSLYTMYHPTHARTYGRNTTSARIEKLS